MEILWLGWPLVAAVANRIRGGWNGDTIRGMFPFWGTTVARLFFSFIMTIPIIFHLQTQQGPTLRTALLMLGFFLLFYIGLVFRWSPWQYMPSPLRDVLALTLRGLVLTLPAGFIVNYKVFMLSGTSMGVIYYLSLFWPISYMDKEGILWTSSDWAEIFFGFALGLALTIDIVILH